MRHHLYVLACALWRLKDGKADEHWDAATIAAPPTGRAGE
jgi:predicted SnoaL-like aldol condensation-catalyzing enzyme